MLNRFSKFNPDERSILRVLLNGHINQVSEISVDLGVRTAAYTVVLEELENELNECEGDYRDMSDQSCYQKAKAKGERTFTLRAQDESSPKIIAAWIKENIETAPEDKLIEALGAAIEMRQHPHRKRAD